MILRPRVSYSIKSLCQLLIQQFEKRFDYEIKSDIYHAASILRVSVLNSWATDDCCKDYYSKGFNVISKAFFEVIKNKESSPSLISPKTPHSAKSESSQFAFSGLFRDDKPTQTSQEQRQSELVQTELLETEVAQFRFTFNYNF